MSFFSKFSASSPANLEKQCFKGQVKSIERYFSEANHNIEDVGYFFRCVNLSKIGVNAYLHSEDVAAEQLHLLVNLISSGR